MVNFLFPVDTKSLTKCRRTITFDVTQRQLEIYHFIAFYIALHE